MRRVFASLLLYLFVALPSSVHAKIELPDIVGCPTINTPASNAYKKENWNACEIWAWSCIRRGLEVNFFAKKCVVPRSGDTYAWRHKYKYAPFITPDRYSLTNRLSGSFLSTLLSQEPYKSEIKSIGIRLLGAYFKDSVNLENVTTEHNLVLDQSIFKDGLRLTNFKTEKNLSLDGSNVRGRIMLLRAKIGGTLFLEEGVYDAVEAADARFGASIDAPASIFNGPFRLDRVRVEGKVSFIRTRLTEFTAWDTTIGSKLEFRYAGVRGRIDLTGTTVLGDLRMQRLKFGRTREPGAPHFCDWNLDAEDQNKDRFFLSPQLPLFLENPDLHKRILKEVIVTRPNRARKDYPCLKVKDDETGEIVSKPMDTDHEILLRDMKIGGTLCMIEITGEIAPPTPGAKNYRDHITSIALDGTESRSTILRWKASESLTLWQGVHFTTKNMFIDLSSQPRRHFFDNLKIGNISFIRLSNTEVSEQTEESRAYLCDIRPGPGARFESDSIDTHQRVVNFFTSEANEANSPQPFGEIVARLSESNSASLMLKMAFSEYTYNKACRTSQFYNLPAKRMAGPSPPTHSGTRNPNAALAATDLDAVGNNIEESQRIFADSACRAAVSAFKYSVAYGHQPFNIVLLMGLFVVFFRTLLIFDNPRKKSATHLGGPRKLGLLYAIDMFTPFASLDPRHNQMRPRRKSLKAYMVFHRVIGLILTGLLIVAFYAARL